jgi:hypothetical protein
VEDIALTADLLGRGMHRDEITRLCRRGDLDRVRRGAYAPPSDVERSVEARHLQLIAATVPQLGAGAIVSHTSAAVLHGLPVWAAAIERVHITRTRSGGGKRRTLVQVHGAPVRADELATVHGVTVTSVARTVADLGRTLPFEQAVAAGDRAVALKLSPDELDNVLRRMTPWPGIRRARRMAAFLDGRSESVGESVSRVRCHEAFLPPPDLQYEVIDSHGTVVGRADFGWRLQRTLGEFDGKAKYGRLLRPGQTIEEVVYAEKLREDALRDHGWQVVRWTWPDLYHWEVIAERLRRAFARTAA